MKQTDSLLEFPCQFPIKAMGRKSEEFDITVVEIVRRHIPDFLENSVRNRVSKGGKYMSVTITVTATHQNQLDAIYQDLSNCQEVLLAL